MSNKTFMVPSISCGHCTQTIKMELEELAGVKAVSASADTKQVMVEWDAPATWDGIKSTLVEINFPPSELIQL